MCTIGSRVFRCEESALNYFGDGGSSGEGKPAACRRTTQTTTRRAMDQ